MKVLGVLGASGHGKVVADAALLSGWDSVVFYDDAWPNVKAVGPWSVEGKAEDLCRNSNKVDASIVAIGNNQIRLEKLQLLIDNNVVIATVTHPNAIVSQYATIGVGTVVFAGSVLNAFVKVGDGCIINTGAIVDHDCIIADGVHVSPGAQLGGAVRVGRGSWVGLGASVKQCVCIGELATIGMGAAVVNDVDGGLTVVGIPAKII